MTSPINPNTVGNKTPNRFRFWISSKNGLQILESAPIGWEDSSIVLGRGFGIGAVFTSGVFSKYKIGDLKFINDGFRILYGTYLGGGEWDKGLFLENKLIAEAKLIVEYRDEDWEYQPFGDLFTFDFNTLKTNKGDTGAIESISISVDQTGLFTLWQKRKNIKLDLTRTKSIGGYQIIDFVDLKKTINIPEISNNFFANWTSSPGATFSIGIQEFLKNPIFVINQELTESDFEEAQSVSDDLILLDDSQPSNNNMILLNSEVDKTLFFNGSAEIQIAPVLNGELFVAAFDGTIKNQISLGTFTGSGIRKTITYDTKSTNEPLEILAGESVILYIGNFTSFAFITTISGQNQMIESVVNIASTSIESIPMDKALLRCCQLIFDKQEPFKSDFFNGVDQETLMNVIGGLNFRGLPLSDRNAPITVKPKEFFNSVGLLNNIGFEFQVIGGDEKLVFEPIDDIFIDEVGFDISDKLNQNEIEEEVFLDGIYSEIETGFKEYSYELINGRAEYNTQNTRTSILPVGEKVELVSTLRGDPKGAFKLLENPVVGKGANASEDVDGDEDAFILKVQKDGATEWKPEVFENYTVLDNSSLFGDASWNLPFTPTNILLKNKNIIATGLDVVQNSVLAYQQSGKLSTLKTKSVATGVEVTENQDIKIKKSIATEPEIGDPKFGIMLMTVKVPFYDANFATLLANKNKLVKVARNKAGWLITDEGFKYDIAKKEATFKLIEKYNFVG